jgi:hypothetical protein
LRSFYYTHNNTHHHEQGRDHGPISQDDHRTTGYCLCLQDAYGMKEPTRSCEAAQEELVRKTEEHVRRVDERKEKGDGYIQHIIQTQEEDDATKGGNVAECRRWGR